LVFHFLNLLRFAKKKKRKTRPSPLKKHARPPLPKTHTQNAHPPISNSLYGSVWREQERRGAVAGAYLAPYLAALPPTKGGAGSSNRVTVISHSLGSFTIAAAGELLYRAGGAAQGSAGRIRSWKCMAAAVPNNGFAPAGGRFYHAPALVGGTDPAAGIDVFYSDKDRSLAGAYETATDLVAMGRTGSTVSGPTSGFEKTPIRNIDTLASTGRTHRTQSGYFGMVGAARLMDGVPTARPRP
jgi:hypothetical protein